MAALTTPTVGQIIPSSRAILADGIAGAAIPEGQPVYEDPADSNKLKLANGDAAGSAIIATVKGLSLHAAAAGQNLKIVMSDPALTHGLTAAEIAPGDIVLLHDTAGKMTITPGDLEVADWVTRLGQINNPETTMNFNPSVPVLKG